jgi:hypothetical protein
VTSFNNIPTSVSTIIEFGVDELMIVCFHGHSFLDDKNWIFFTESKEHVVFKQIKITCCLLKVTKENSNEYNFSSSSQLDFLSNNPLKWWGQHAFMPNLIEVSESMLDTLTKIWEQERINERTITNSTRNLSRIGFIEPDAFALQEYLTLGFEFKVKSAYPSISPFLSNSTLKIKRQFSRFQYMQFYKFLKKKLSGEHIAAWGEYQGLSCYSPSDILSRDIDRILIALNALFENPQNNLKIVFQNHSIYGWDLHDFQSVFHTIPPFLNLVRTDGQCDSPNLLTNSITFIQRILGEIIRNDRSLQDLLLMQVLEIIDSEGASMIYLHLLVKWFAKDETACQNMLLEYMCQPMTSTLRQLATYLLELHEQASIDENQFLHKLSELSLSSGLLKLLQLIVIERNLHAQPSSTPSSLEAEQIVTEEFTFEDSCFLLKMWMLGCIACDASWIVTLGRIEEQSTTTNLEKLVSFLSHSKEEFSTLLSSSSSVSFHFDSSQSHRGNCDCYLNNDLIFSVVYQSTMIDVGLKAFSKLTKKAIDDEKICDFISENL